MVQGPRSSSGRTGRRTLAPPRAMPCVSRDSSSPPRPVLSQSLGGYCASRICIWKMKLMNLGHGSYWNRVLLLGPLPGDHPLSMRVLRSLRNGLTRRTGPATGLPARGSATTQRRGTLAGARRHAGCGHRGGGRVGAVGAPQTRPSSLHRDVYSLVQSHSLLATWSVPCPCENGVNFLLPPHEAA